MFRALATGPDLPVRTDIDVDAAYRRHRLSIIIAVTAGYGLSYTCRLALNVVKKPLIDGGIFSPADLGTIGSALFYSYAAGRRAWRWRCGAGFAPGSNRSAAPRRPTPGRGCR